MFELLELSLADTRRMFDYKQNCEMQIAFGLKGFTYGWLLANRQWKTHEKVLDVGGAYSEFPIFLQKKYGCETWVVDDFGTGSNEPFWTRQRSPQEHIQQHPEVKYVLERVGDPQKSSLPLGAFDVVYSVSTLEHVPGSLTLDVWRHLGALVKEGGELWHSIDVPFPSNGGLKKILFGLLYDAFNWAAPLGFRMSHFLATPRNYARLALRALEVTPQSRHKPLKYGSRLDVLNMALNPEVIAETYEYGYNRIVKDKVPNYHFERLGSLLIGLRKVK
jgi:hypothetical protein